MNVKEKDATSTLSVFGMHVVTRTGHYTWAENLLFGDEASRKKQLDSLRQKMDTRLHLDFLKHDSEEEAGQVQRLSTWVGLEH